MRDVAQGIRDKQRSWLQSVIADHGVKPTPLARAAGVAPTTLTRKLNDPDDTAILSELTIARICNFLGISHPNFTDDAPAIGFSDQEAEPYEASLGDPLAAVVKAAIGDREHVVAWVLRSRALEDEGYKPGDILIVDLNRMAQAGDIVCAQLYDWERPGRTRTVFRIYHAPYLVGAGPEPGARIPHLVDNRTVMIKGVVKFNFRASS
jgi:DNA-binding Xre family transcriptional regulator